MKVLTYMQGGHKAVGILKKNGQEVVPVNYLGCGLVNMTEFIASMTEEKMRKLEKNAELMDGIPMEEVRLLSPIVHPKQDVICLGINYYAHAEEAARFHDEAFGGERPQPIYFSKRVNRAVGDGEPVDGHFDIVDSLDYEAELAVIIGKDAKNVADETIRVFQKAGPGASMKDLEKTRQKLRGNIDDKNSRLSVSAKKEPKAPSLKPEQLKKGDAVRVVSMGLKGTVSSLPDAKGNLFVQCGILRTSTNIKDLVRIEEATITAPNLQKTGSGKIRMSKSFSISPEINLLGKTVDEALAALDKYLDDAYLAHLESVRVVHGKGTGALRNAVQQHLRRVKYVKSFRQGEYGEGDAGVTIVVFK